MKELWFKGSTAPRDVRRQQVLSCRNSFELLRDVLMAEYKKKPAARDYGEPGWEHRQIAVNEYNQVLEDILSIIDLKD